MMVVNFIGSFALIVLGLYCMVAKHNLIKPAAPPPSLPSPS